MAKKILIVTHCFPTNRNDLVGNFLYNFSGHLKKLGCEVSVFTPRMNGEYDHEYQTNVLKEIVFFDWKGGDKRLAEFKISSVKDLISLLSLFKNGKKMLNKHLNKNKYDFILAPWVIPSGYFVNKVAKKHKTPFAVWALGSDINVYAKKPFISGLVTKIMKNSDTVFTNNFQMKKIIKNLYQVNPLILFTNRKLPVPDVSHSKNNKFRILFIGRLEYVKGPDILLDALLQSGIKNYQLRLVGDGSMRKELELFARANGMNDRVSFLGHQGQDVISKELKQSDYLVISSRNEGMPVVFWEAMQMNTPVLTTDCGDIEYYNSKFNVGRTSEVSAKSLGELLNFAANFKPLRDTLSKNTEKLSDLSDIKASAEKFIQIIS